MENRSYPLFSLIVPVYNVEQYLRKCINSIIFQTFQKWELILIDDGSPDESPYICDEYALNDSRIKVIHKKNGGVSSARNCGLNIAKGQWIWYVDPDDWIAENALNELSKVVLTHNTDCVIFGIEYYDEDGNIVGKEERTEKKGEKHIVLESNDYAPQSIIQKRSIIESNTIRFTEGIRMGEDLELQYKFLITCKHPIRISNTLYFGLRRMGSAMLNPRSIQNAAEDIPKVLTNIVSFIEENNVQESAWLAARINRTFKSAMSMNSLISHPDTVVLQRILRESNTKLKDRGFHLYSDMAVKVGVFNVKLYFLFLKLRKFIYK